MGQGLTVRLVWRGSEVSRRNDLSNDKKKLSKETIFITLVSSSQLPLLLLHY